MLRRLLIDWPSHAAAERPLIVTVSEYRARRNAAQNRLLHALIDEIAESARPGGRQYDNEFWKEYIRRKFIGTEDMTLPDGTRIERGISTSALSVGEFAELIDKVQAWAVLELGLDTPLAL